MNEWFRLVSDDDGHWFLIPEAAVSKFYILLADGAESGDYQKFEEAFLSYGLNGGPEHVRIPTGWEYGL